jgi:hypothetical protein
MRSSRRFLGHCAFLGDTIGNLLQSPTVDETEKRRQQQGAERLARRSRVAEAGGQLVAAAFAFLGEMIPPRQPTKSTHPTKSSADDGILRSILTMYVIPLLAGGKLSRAT